MAVAIWPAKPLAGSPAGSGTGGRPKSEPPKRNSPHMLRIEQVAHLDHRGARALGGERDGLRVVRVELHGGAIAGFAGDLAEPPERPLRHLGAAERLADGLPIGVAPRRLGAQFQGPRQLRREVARRLAAQPGADLARQRLQPQPQQRRIRVEPPEHVDPDHPSPSSIVPCGRHQRTAASSESHMDCSVPSTRAFAA
ncbi:hypothetical protein [Siccirubricoccus sp. G192]|uniref:hypothetical protein n=1 Tax=Siccirubricoccus sp. G192 TaxID=2849651 RepID=UPI001C2C54A6|nr:hypothetical protein [Siccirubricoccus sp. G192]MBV1797687.1 hypothetical protein [Siccirubricoccus sp. G192]